MRTKAFLMSTGLAASVWLTGCQNTGLNKLPCFGTCGTSSTAKGVPAGKESLHADMTRSSSDKTRVASLVKTPASAPAASCTTCATCSVDGSAESAVKGAPVAVTSCDSCAAQTGSAGIRDSTTFTLPGAPPAAPPMNTLPPAAHQHPAAPTTSNLPNPVISLPPSIGVITAPTNSEIVSAPNGSQNQAPAGGSYGAGVEVVAGQLGDAPAATAGERPAAKNVMTVRFGQDNNYQTVVGQVYQFRRAWKLRYTAVESDDRYGGSFTLVGENLDGLKDGQMIRVQGAVLPSEDRTSGARYQVSRVEVIEPDLK